MPLCPELSKHASACHLLGGSIVDPDGYDHTQDGFDKFLKASGVHYFSGEELSTPRHPAIAKQYGFKDFVPPQMYWHRSAAVALVADICRREAGGPIHCYNHWRPLPYNKRVAGSSSPLTDHPNCCAVDLWFPGGPEAREKAEKRMWHMYWSGVLKLSLGFGLANLHVGVLSPIGQRHWYYKNYPR